MNPLVKRQINHPTRKIPLSIPTACIYSNSLGNISGIRSENICTVMEIVDRSLK
jgi:hypothetical protein